MKISKYKPSLRIGRHVRVVFQAGLGVMWAVFVLSCRAQKEEAAENVGSNPPQIRAGQFAAGLTYS